MKKGFKICLAGVIAGLLMCACGYRFEGGGYLKKEVRTVSVAVFENLSAEDMADLTFTNELVQEIVDKSDTRVVDGDRADAVIYGTIRSISFATLSRSSTESVLERRISAVLDVRMLDREKSVIWSVKDFSVHEESEVSDGQLEDESNKSAALEKIAQRSAEKLVSRMLTNF